MTTPLEIRINGVDLTQAHCETIRISLEVFMEYLCQNGLGDDDLGREDCENYKNCIKMLRKLMRENDDNTL